MDTSILEKSIESMIDWIVCSDNEQMKREIDDLRSLYPHYSQRQLASFILEKQSLWSGLLGGLTGLGGLITLPATIPIDLIKAWKVQAYTVKCISHIYNALPDQSDDLKTDIFLLLSTGSTQEIKDLVAHEAHKQAIEKAASLVENLKKKAIKQTAKKSPKIIAKTAVALGGKKIAGYSMKGFSKYIVKALWKVGGKKIAEKAIQKSISKAVPLVGAVLGAGFDYMITKSVGKLAIDYYEQDIPAQLFELIHIYSKDFESSSYEHWDARLEKFLAESQAQSSSTLSS